MAIFVSSPVITARSGSISTGCFSIPVALRRSSGNWRRSSEAMRSRSSSGLWSAARFWRIWSRSSSDRPSPMPNRAAPPRPSAQRCRVSSARSHGDASARQAGRHCGRRDQRRVGVARNVRRVRRGGREAHGRRRSRHPRRRRFRVRRDEGNWPRIASDAAPSAVEAGGLPTLRARDASGVSPPAI